MDQARFSAQPDTAGRGYGVHDSEAGDWCTPAILTESAAAELAAELNDFETAGHQVGEIRCIAPLKAQARTWEPAGSVDAWVWDTNSHPPQWVGRVREQDGWVRWYAGADLRPATSTT
ncbi:hypothetical protein ACI2LF_43695 [Kribbella sp. NPDC020789]